MPGDDQSSKRFGPRAFYQARRPERFSDSSPSAGHHLDRPFLEYHLDSITSRSQEAQFETFARKVAERTVCPNLMPHTGPTGGGDSKVDTETYPVAQELAMGWYVGTPEAANEPWAFAISAKADWRSKVRADVKSIAETKRGYSKIFFISSRFIRDKDRAELEDELKATYGIPVKLFDRNWLLDRVFGQHLEPLAVDELGLPSSLKPIIEKGANDVSREKSLQELEVRIQSALSEQRHTPQLVEDCIQAALLTRALERPRTEVDGQFARAQRIAKRLGSRHQQLEAAYQHAWTTFWWYEDFESFSELYGDVESLAKGSDNAHDIELLSNLWFVLRGAVYSGHLDRPKAALDDRGAVLYCETLRLAADENRLSAALQAHTIQLLMMLDPVAPELVPAVLPQLEKVVRDSADLVGYPYQPLIEILQELGPFLAEFPGHDALFETILEITSKRDGDISGALLLVERGKQQLDAKKPYDAIKTLGRALSRLYKHETRHELVKALLLTGAAYAEIGLLWAARGSYLAAASIATNEFWAYEDVTLLQAAAYNRMKWVELQLGRVTHVLAWHELDRVVRAALAQKGYDRKRLSEGEVQFSAILGMLFLRATIDQLPALAELPETLDRLDLLVPRSALLYALGHEHEVPPELLGEARDAAAVRAFFEKWAQQPAGEDIAAEPELLLGPTVTLESDLLGCRIEILSENRSPCIEVGESILAATEAFLATGLRERIMARDPVLPITIKMDAKQEAWLSISVDDSQGRPSIEIRCKNFNPHSLNRDQQNDLKDSLFSAVVEVFSRGFLVPDGEKTLTTLLRDDRASERALNFTGSFVVLGNVLGHQAKLTLAAWNDPAKKYELLRVETWRNGSPVTTPPPRQQPGVEGTEDHARTKREQLSHRRMQTISLIRIGLWDKARWGGTAYFTSPALDEPTIMAPFFADEEAAAKIFDGLKSEIGRTDPQDRLRVAIIRGFDRNNPHWYRIVIGTNLPHEPATPDTGMIFMVARVNTMQPSSGSNLQAFLDRTSRLHRFILAPAVMREDGPHVIPDRSIEKSSVVVRDAWQIGRHDPDVVAIDADDDPVIPPGTENAPVTELLEYLRKKEPKDDD
jgi:tetratricopeptide (TPR) repeat protein